MIIARRLVLSIFLLGWTGGCSGDDAAESEPDGQDELAQRLEAPDDVAGIPSDAEVTDSGLGSKILVEGTGTRSPTETDTVRVHYTGWQTNGTRFDSSRARGRPSEFALNRVIDGWTEGLQLMVEGEERRFWIPANLAYEGVDDRPQGMLVFDVELLEILTPP